jgi:hypothetical protein
MVKIVQNLFDKVIEPECIRILKVLENLSSHSSSSFSKEITNNNNDTNANNNNNSDLSRTQSKTNTNTSETRKSKIVGYSNERLKLMNTDVNLISASLAQMASLRDRISHILKNKNIIFFDTTVVEKTTEPEMNEHLTSIENSLIRLQQTVTKCKIWFFFFFLLWKLVVVLPLFYFFFELR